MAMAIKAVLFMLINASAPQSIKQYYFYFLYFSFYQAMRLTTFTDYTLRVLMYLAVEPGRLATISEMAAAYAISENHLMKVVYQLGQTGVVESIRGKGGGVRLARRPQDIRLGKVIRASEGVAPIVECLSPEGGFCRITPACRLAGILSEAFEALYASLDAYTVEDLVTNRRALRRLLAARP